MSKKRASESESLADLSFEQAMERLERIVERIEGGQVGLEQALSEYEQGIAMWRRCREILGRVEQRVEELGKLAAAEAGRKASPAGGGSGPTGAAKDDGEPEGDLPF